MATIKDVARQAGVGQGTVSRVLNDSGYVSEEARQRVLDAVQALKYVPNAQARAMMTKRTMTIGVTLPDLTQPGAWHSGRGQALWVHGHSGGNRLAGSKRETGG